MGSTPQTSNAFANFINKITNAAISGGEIAVEAIIVAEVPLLANPFFKFVLDQIITEIGKEFNINTNIFLDYLIIDYQTNGEKSKVYQALKNLTESLNGGNQDAINKATEDAKTSWGNAIHWDGSANPNPA